MIITGILLLATMATGAWLYLLGRPLNNLFFTLHKLAALAAVIYGAFFFHGIIRGSDAGTTVTILAGVTILLIVLLFVTGGLMSRAKPMENLSLVHGLASLFMIASSGITLYLLTG
jgi:hypothetical protein